MLTNIYTPLFILSRISLVKQKMGVFLICLRMEIPFYQMALLGAKKRNDVKSNEIRPKLKSNNLETKRRHPKLGGREVFVVGCT